MDMNMKWENWNQQKNREMSMTIEEHISKPFEKFDIRYACQNINQSAYKHICAVGVHSYMRQNNQAGVKIV